jgi:hypothetical protein
MQVLNIRMLCAQRVRRIASGIHDCADVPPGAEDSRLVDEVAWGIIKWVREQLFDYHAKFPPPAASLPGVLDLLAVAHQVQGQGSMRQVLLLLIVLWGSMTGTRRTCSLMLATCQYDVH